MGTNNDDNGQSGTKIDEQDAFSAISAALNGGDFESLDRLMAVKEEEEKAKAEAKGATESQSEENPPESGKDGKQDDDTSKNDEAALAAASTEQKMEENPTGPEAELQALKAELHRLRSDAGRVGHLQRTVQDLQRQIRANEARVAETKPNSEKTPPKAKEIPEELRKRIDSLKEIDPDLADTFEAFAKTMVSTAEEKAGEVKQSVEEYQAEQENFRFWQEQKQELYKMVPRHDEIFAMPEWQEWKERLTPGTKALTESGYANDMASAIYMFANYMNARQQGNNAGAPRQASSEGGDLDKSTNAAVTQANTEVVEARARKVGAAAEVKTPAAKKETELDGDAYFREMYRKLAKENHIG